MANEKQPTTPTAVVTASLPEDTIRARWQASLDGQTWHDMNPSKPTVPEVLPLVLAYYAKPNNGAGGSLHIVLDDGNVDDDHVRFCIEWARERGDEDGVRLAEILLRMSKTQRKKLYLAPKCPR